MPSNIVLVPGDDHIGPQTEWLYGSMLLRMLMFDQLVYEDIIIRFGQGVFLEWFVKCSIAHNGTKVRHNNQ